MKAYLKNNEIIYSNDEPRGATSICERPFTEAELRWPKLNAVGNDIEVDVAAKVLVESARKKQLQSELIYKIDSEIRSILSFYPEHEKMSFGTKNEEAVKFLAGTRPAHSLLIGESMEKYGDATDANVTLIANRIVLNSDPYGLLIGRATAVRSRIKAEIENHADILNYNLPAVLL